MMKKVTLSVVSTAFFICGYAQLVGGQNDKPQTVTPKDQSKVAGGGDKTGFNFTVEKSLPATPVKNQAMTGTCWCFSTTSLVESQCLKNNLGEFDLSEMFSVRNVYVEKAKNYILRQGHAQFGEGGLGHDLIRAISLYGAVPEEVYTGLKEGQQQHNHIKLVGNLKRYLDSVLAIKPLPNGWLAGYTHILDTTLGKMPEKFTYKGKAYTPKSFAEEALHFNANDYVNITSFTHHSYYEPFVLEVPDNFSNGAYYNLPLAEMIQLVKDAVNKGYTVLWDADVSNDGFQQEYGSAVNLENIPTNIIRTKASIFTGEVKEGKADTATRQKLFENLTTQDDHLMHIVGLAKSKSGGSFFLVKNSWGDIGPAHGYINVSEDYFAINTISLVIPKAALSKSLLDKLKIGK
ncbi:C1 family peptidase [Ferruginibacter sp.]